MTRVLVISFSDLARDPRVDRQISFLAREHEVVAAGFAPSAVEGVEFVDLSLPHRAGGRVAHKARWLDTTAKSLTLRLVGLHERAYWRDPLKRAAARRLQRCDADVVIANDLPALPLASRVAGDSPVIFDAHELSIDEHSDLMWWRITTAPHADAILRSYLPRITGMTTVSPGIAERYADLYRVNPVVVTNAPPSTSLRPTEIGAPIRLIHHGCALAERRLELMLEAMELLDDGFQLDLMLMRSQPRYFARLERLVRGMRRVRLIPAVGQRAIVEACNAYDIGVYALPPTNDNLRLALPNKLFEFIQARLALVVGPSPEMARIVNEYDCGVVAHEFTPEALAEAIGSLSSTAIVAYKAHSDRAAALLNAEQNRAAVLGVVARALR